jgi:uncharacterized protein YjiS (DUF1127 family)
MLADGNGVAATHPFAASTARNRVGLDPCRKAIGISHAIRVLDGQAGGPTADAASGSAAGGKGLAGIVIRIAAWIARTMADELRIRRVMRQLMAMDENMLKDIGLTRADIGGSRYGRD